MAGVSERVVDHLESMEADQILSRAVNKWRRLTLSRAALLVWTTLWQARLG
jgi:hypothetical protein